MLTADFGNKGGRTCTFLIIQNLGEIDITTGSTDHSRRKSNHTTNEKLPLEEEGIILIQLPVPPELRELGQKEIRNIPPSSQCKSTEKN